MWHEVLHVAGITDLSGRWYGLWSGIGSDLGELAIIGGLIGAYRKHQCEAAGCHRIARHVTNGNHSVCRRHHPDGEPTAHDIARAHEEARNVA